MPTSLSRSLLAVLIPGLIAVAPWLLALVQYTEATLGLTSYPTLGNALLVAAAACAGTILEGIGSFLEVRWDKERESSYAVNENWFEYLSRRFDHEPVGYRYLSRLATTLAFELSMIIATPAFLLGAAFLTSLRFAQLACAAWIIGPVIATLCGIFFWRQARVTHETLCKTRRELNTRLGSSATSPAERGG